MAPKSFYENLLESLTDQKVIDVLGKTLRAIIQDIIAPIMLEVDKVVKKCGEQEKKVGTAGSRSPKSSSESQQTDR